MLYPAFEGENNSKSMFYGYNQSKMRKTPLPPSPLRFCFVSRLKNGPT